MLSPNTSLILVIGANGFLGSNVVLQLLNEGYRVRGTVRGTKIQNFREYIGDKYPSLELVLLDDVGTDDLTEVFQGVDAIIHTAAPGPFGGTTREEDLNIAIEGYLNVFRQAVKNGISKVVATSSWCSTINPTLEQAFQGIVTTENDWGTVTKDQFITQEHDRLWSYVASKILGEQAAWEFAASEPSFDLTMILPPMLYGPLSPIFPAPPLSALTTNRSIYTILTGNIPPPLPPLFCDIRDAARAHTAVLRIPPSSPSTPSTNRIQIAGGFMIWSDVISYLRATRPAALQARLPSATTHPAPFPGPPARANVARAREMLGMEVYFDWKKTVDDAVDTLLVAEASGGWDNNRDVNVNLP